MRINCWICKDKATDFYLYKGAHKVGPCLPFCKVCANSWALPQNANIASNGNEFRQLSKEEFIVANVMES
jgi:hypothetical protein